jgi:glycosyltransferase involved in cell wall biosynthesis
MPVKISVIMASYLGEYMFAAKNRVDKFNRAINSFKSQTYTNKELIIVSDGCPLTIAESTKHLSEEIKLFGLTKQEYFSGAVREYGCKQATGDIICYLDTDDFFGNNHLQIIASSIQNYDWIYFNDTIIYRFHPTENRILSSVVRETKLERGSIGTSAIAHKNLPKISWSGCNGYGHDWDFIQKLMSNPNHAKIANSEYKVCHIPNSSVDC